MRQIAQEAYGVDLDRTVYRTDIAFEKMVRLAVANSLAPAGALEEARAALEATGGSFDLMYDLRQRGVPQDEIDGLQRVFGDNKEGDDFLHPDARPLFRAFHETSASYFMWTKGGRGTQIAKLRSCILPDQAGTLFDQPYLITDNTRKGKDIVGMWVPAKQLYAVDALRGAQERVRLLARTIFLVEDKPRALEGLPDDCSGALVRQSQEGVVPARVLVTPDLTAVTERVYQNAK